MLNFIKKQFLKILFYLAVIITSNAFWIFKGWNISLFISYNSFITSIFAFVMSKTWIEDYKLEVNKELEKNKNELNKELEKYKTKLSSYTLVTKLQYDLEFKMYLNFSKMISETIKFLIFLKNEINEKTNADARDSIFKFGDEVSKYKPFCDKEIHSTLMMILYLMQEDYYFILKNQPKVQEKDSYGDELTNLYEEILSNLIRQRIENMKIIED